MNGPTYTTTANFADLNTVLVRMDDPVFNRPWYLKGVRNGQYSWTRNALFAKDFRPATAAKHVKALKAGADTAWNTYRETWM